MDNAHTLIQACPVCGKPRRFILRDGQLVMSFHGYKAAAYGHSRACRGTYSLPDGTIHEWPVDNA